MQRSVLLLLLPALLATPCMAGEDVIEEIVVTADYRETQLSDLAASVSVIGEEQISARNAHHIEDILGMAANVNYASGASRARFYQIRGIGERGQFAETLISSVGLIIDDVDLSGAGTVATLFDVDQVEILRGPQGTRYGANALAGLINIKTREPSIDPDYRIMLEGANFNSYSVGAAFSGPLGSDQLLYRVAAQRYKSDGFNDNDFLDEPTNKRDEATVRGKLHWQASDSLQLDLNASLIDVDNGYDAFSLDNVRDTLSDEPGHDKQRTRIAGGKITWSDPEPFYMQAIFGYTNSDSEYGYDEDWVDADFHPWGYTSTDDYIRERDTLNGEIRLISKDNAPIWGDTTAWLVGIYSLDQREELMRRYTWLAGDFLSRYEIDRLALYGQLDTTFSESWSLTVGLRYEMFEADYRDSDGVLFSPDENMVGGRVVLNRELPSGSLVYLGISRGYKSGGFNPDTRLDAGQRAFDSESLWNYELGLKGRWLEERLTAQIAVFYMDRRDVQISSSIADVNPDGSPVFIELVGNAAEGDNTGMELEARLAVTERIQAFGSIGFLNTEYVDYNNPDPEREGLDGRDQAHAPKYQFSVGGQVDFTDRCYGRVVWEAKDDFYFSDSHDFRSDSYQLIHADVGYEANGWRVSFWARNLTDEDYFVRGFFFGNDPRDDYTPKGYTQLGEPRRYGMTVTVDM
jgi:iron complex outermembrane receptor protein